MSYHKNENLKLIAKFYFIFFFIIEGTQAIGPFTYHTKEKRFFTKLRWALLLLTAQHSIKEMVVTKNSIYKKNTEII